MKVVTLECTFPELKGARYAQQGRGRASNVQAAFAAAGRDLFKRPGLKAQRYTYFTTTVTIATVKENTDEAKAEGHPAQPLP
jgi:hypothetical protein